MQKALLKHGQRKILGYLYYFLNVKAQTPQELIKTILAGVTETRVGFAGFSTKKFLAQHLRYKILSSAIKSKPYSQPSLKFKTAKDLIREALIRCQKELPIGPIYIFIFPTLKPEIKEKTNGITGFCPWRNTINIFIHPEAEQIRTPLFSVIAHEYNHAAIRRHYEWETLLDSLIYEGLAEIFQEEITGRRCPCTKAVPKSKLQTYLEQIKPYLHSKDQELIRAVFMGGEGFPHWLGYSLGYWLVNRFLAKLGTKNWPEIIRKVPDAKLEILS